MKFEFDNQEMSALLVSLVGRVRDINGLLDVKDMSDSFYSGYRQELEVVKGLLERFFPGSVERIIANMAA